MSVSKRNPLIAAVMSLLVPGLGQMYNGELKKGVQLLFLQCAGIVLLLSIMRFGSDYRLLNLLLLLIYAGLILALPVEAALSARRTPYPEINYQWIRYIQYTLVTLLIIRFPLWGVVNITVAKAHEVPTASMANTLLQGDCFLTFRRFYSWKPDRNDVVTFNYPQDRSVTYVKRIIACPGELFEFRGEKVLIDSQVLNETSSGIHYRKVDYPSYFKTDLSITIPKAGDTLDLTTPDLRLFQFYKLLIRQENPHDYIPEKIELWVADSSGVMSNYSDSTITVQNIDEQSMSARFIALKNGEEIIFSRNNNFSMIGARSASWMQYYAARNSWCEILSQSLGGRKCELRFSVSHKGEKLESYEVQHDAYFVMGDNRNNSVDSRFFGFVSRKNITGEVGMIYFSAPSQWSDDTFLDRFSRIGIPVK